MKYCDNDGIIRPVEPEPKIEPPASELDSKCLSDD